MDTVHGKTSHHEILESFSSKKADILLGTQMIAKGLDFENVTLVGIINADSGLFFPDFRAGERVFQLIYQVAGRAGRRAKPGLAIIQTFNPNDIYIQTASLLDTHKFYNILNETQMKPLQKWYKHHKERDERLDLFRYEADSVLGDGDGGDFTL